MLPVNTMAYGAETFQFRRQSLLKSNVPLDFTYETSCSGFEINGTEPEGCKRRIIFEIDNKLYRFGNSGLDEYEFRGELEDILVEGNTVAELLAINSVPQFIGKQVYIWVALDAPADSPVMPKIKIAAKVNSFNDVYAKNEFSPIYELPENAKIYNLIADTNTNGNGAVTIYARTFNPANNTWSNFDYLPNFANKIASKIQYRLNYLVTTLDGSDAARCNNIKCFYTTDADLLSGATQEIISLPQDYHTDLKTCYALLKHSELIDAEIKCYLFLTPRGEVRENVMIGTYQTTDGENNQTFYLSYNGVVDTNISQDTIHLFQTPNGGSILNSRLISDFYFDTENSTVTLKAEEGAEIYASYECGTAEEWIEMVSDSVTEDNGVYSTRFIYRATGTADRKIAAVKFVITRLADKVDQTEIATGTGKLQIFALPHKAKAETLIASGNWIYDEDAQILKTVAPINTPVTVQYDWQGQFPTIYEYIWGVSTV